MSISKLSIGYNYTFNTLSPGILGAAFTNVKLIGIMDYESAMAIRNIDILYNAIYPVLPSGTINNSKSNVYYQFKTLSGTSEILAEQWIDVPSITQVADISFQVNIHNVGVQDMSKIRDVLTGMGYTNFDIKQL